MKASLLTLFFAALCFHPMAQKNDVQGYVIRGFIGDAENNSKVFLYDIDEQVFTDSAIISQGNFTMKGHVEKPTICWIRYKDEYAIVHVENTTIEFRSPARSMRLYAQIKGGREQQLQNELSALQFPYDKVFFTVYDSIQKEQYRDQADRERMVKLFNETQDISQEIYVDFGRRHPDSYLGLDILYRNRERIGKDTLEHLLPLMNENLQATSKAQALREFIYGELAEKGKRFIDFEVQTSEGKPFRLSSLEGNYILLSFWDAACVPCRKENKTLSLQYERVKKKLSIVSFSIDKNKTDWLNASKADHIRWTNVSDLQGTNGKIKTQYGVQAIPAAFLINKAGIIIEKFTGFSDDFLDQLDKLIINK